MDDGDGAWMDGRGIKVRHRDGYRKTKKTGSSNRKARERQKTTAAEAGGTMRFIFNAHEALQTSTSRCQRTPCLDLNNALLFSAAFPGTIFLTDPPFVSSSSAAEA